MFSYRYQLLFGVDPAVALADIIAGTGLPITTVALSLGYIVVTTDRELTTEEQATLAAFVAAYHPLPWRKRRLLDIYTDITALSGANQTAIWTDLSAGTPPRWATDVGPNAAALFALQFLATAVAGLTTAERNEARRRVAAFYVGDNPKYLVNPAFAPAINVNGEEQYTP